MPVPRKPYNLGGAFAFAKNALPIGGPSRFSGSASSVISVVINPGLEGSKILARMPIEPPPGTGPDRGVVPNIY